MDKNLKFSVILRNICICAEIFTALAFLFSMEMRHIYGRMIPHPIDRITIYFEAGALAAAFIGFLAILVLFVHFLKILFLNECSERITFKIFGNCIISLIMCILAFWAFCISIPVA